MVKVIETTVSCQVKPPNSNSFSLNKCWWENREDHLHLRLRKRNLHLRMRKKKSSLENEKEQNSLENERKKYLTENIISRYVQKALNYQTENIICTYVKPDCSKKEQTILKQQQGEHRSINSKRVFFLFSIALRI